MKKIISIIALVLAVASANAQERWSLRECIDYAVENNITLRQTALNVEMAQIDLNTARNSRLPSLNAGVNQNFSFGRTTSDNYDYLVNSQASNTSFSVSTDIPVFEGFRINNQVKTAKLDLQAATAGLERAKEALELNVTALYLDVLFKGEIVEVYRNQTALSRSQVTNTRKMVDEGKVALSQLYDIEAQLASDEVALINAQNDLTLSLLSLEQALNLEHSADFDIEIPSTEQFAAAGAVPLLLPDEIYTTALGIKPVVREAELKLQSSEHQVKIAQSSYWPSLSLGASYGNGYYYRFGKEFSGQASFADQIRDKHSESVGLNLSIPIFNRNRNRNSVRAARIGVTNNTLELANVQLALYKEIHQAYQRAVAARSRWDATSRALTASEESARAMQIRYENGKATVTEYDEANTRLVSSRSEQAQAKYDYLFSTKVLDFYLGQQIVL